MSSLTYRGSATAAQRQAQLSRQAAIQQQLAAQKQAIDEQQRRRRRTTIIIIVIVAIVLLILIGVAVWFFLLRKTTPTSGGSSTGGGTSGVALGGTCSDTSQCTTGLICSGNKCTNPPQSTCTTSATCPNGYVCSAGTCKGLKSATCSNDKDCSGQFKCTNQVCVARTCTTPADCPNAAANNGNCVAGVCVGGHLDACTDQTQCSSFFVCDTAQVCGGLLNDPCASTADCHTPYICTSGKCVVQTCAAVGTCTNTQTGVDLEPARCDTTGCANGLFSPCLEQTQCGDPALVTCDTGVQSCLGKGGMPCLLVNGGAECVSNNCAANLSTLTDTCTCQVDADCIPSLPHCKSAGSYNYCSATP